MQKIYTKILIEDTGYGDDDTDPEGTDGSITYIVDEDGMKAQINEESLSLSWEAWDEVCAAINAARKELGA